MRAQSEGLLEDEPDQLTVNRCGRRFKTRGLNIKAECVQVFVQTSVLQVSAWTGDSQPHR